jgi:hypothetical protein
VTSGERRKDSELTQRTQRKEEGTEKSTEKRKRDSSSPAAGSSE